MWHKLGIAAFSAWLALSGGAVAAPSGEDKAASHMTIFDRSWVQRAYRDAEQEIRLAQLASTKSKSPQVKALGRLTMRDFSKANSELRTLAGLKGLKLTPADLKSDSLYQELNALDGLEFDKKYVEDVANAHHQNIADFQSEANHGNDPNIQAWAAQKVPTLQRHLQAANNARAALAR